jgi:hypothetical protein
MSEPTSDENEPSSNHATSGSNDPLLTVKPTVKPALIRLGLVVLVAAVVLGVLFTNPTLLGSRDATNVGLLVVQILASIGVLRLLVRIFVLRRTKYVVNSDSIKRSYELFMRTNERQVPFNLVRSHEFNQSRTENLLGHGTITLNQGLGDLKLWNIPKPQEVYDLVRERVKSK